MSPERREGQVRANGVELFYRVVGREPAAGAGPVVVLHGGPGFSMEYFGEALDPLAVRHTLFLYDQRGTGRSSLVNDAAALHADRFVDDLEAIRRHLGVGQLTLLGHSWGAALAALYAMRWPARVGRMVFVGANPLRKAGLRRTFEIVEERRSEESRRQLRAAGAAWRADPGDAAKCRAYYRLWFEPFYGNPEAARLGGDFCAGAPEALRNKVAGVDRFTMGSLGEWDWRDALGDVTAGVLLVHGTHDVIPADTAREWREALPDARLLLLDGIGHFPYAEAPGRFFPAVESFLSGAWPEGAE